MFIPMQTYKQEQDHSNSNTTPNENVTRTSSPFTSGSSYELSSVSVEPPRKGAPKKNTFQKTEIFKQDTGDRIDVHSRYIFPLAYVMFIGVYWFVFAIQ